MLAQYHGLFGEVEAARQSYQSAIQLAPQNVEVVRQAVMYELSQGDAQSAMTLVDRSRQTVADKEQIEQLATQVRLANASAPASLRELAKSMAKDPQRSAQAKAIDALASAIESGAPGDDPDLARALADLARQYPAAIALQQRAITQLIQANMPLDAADLARRLAQAMPTHAVALRLAARTALQCGRPGEAQDYAQRWRASTGDPVEQMDADFVLASILMGNDRVQEAMNRIRPHLANVKGEQEFNVMVAAQVIRRAGSASDAARFLEPMLATSTPARSAWMSISSSLSDVVARRAMLTQFARVVASTASVDTLSLAGEWASVFERSSDPADLKKAVELAEQCLAVPELKRSATLVLAEALRRSGDDKRSVALLEELVKSDANDAAAANALAFTLLSIGQANDRAEALARTSATLAPQAAVPLDTLARVLVARGKPDEAAATFEQALKLDRNYLDAMVGLASLRQSQQRADQVQLLMSRVDQRLTELGSSPAFVVPSHLRSELAKLREGVSTVPAQ